MRLLQLRYFRDVGITLNISKAAEMNSIPQPAMSRAIIELEEELGKQLFDRVKKRLHLTQDGMLFLEEVEQMLYHLDKGIEKVQCKDIVELKGKVSLLLLHPFRSVFDCIEAFSSLHPAVEINITSQQDCQALRESSIDFCIGSIENHDKFNYRLALFHSQVMAAIPVSHYLAKQKTIHLYELENETFAASNLNTQLWKNALNLCRKTGFEPKFKVTSDDALCFEHFLRSGKYVSLVPAPFRLLSAEKESDIVLRPLAPSFLISTDICWDDRFTMSQAAQGFLNHIKSYNFEETAS